MNAVEKKVQLDDGDSEAVEVDLLEMSVDVADEAVLAGTHRASGSERDLKRSQFANGPAACSAAQMLEQALGLLSPALVCARFERRMLRRVNYRFDRGVVPRALGVEGSEA